MFTKKINIFILLIQATITPLFVFAENANGTPLGRLIGLTSTWVSQIAPILGGIALLAFFWGLVGYIWNSGSEEAKEKGRRIMIGGSIALFFFFSIWGVMFFIGKTLLGNSYETDIGNGLPAPQLQL